MTTTTTTNTSDVREAVRARYGRIAADGGGCCGDGTSSCGCGCSAPAATATEPMDALGYTADQRAAVPEGSDLGLGCGNPLGHGAVRPGETVLDLGSGAGIDAFLSARETGPSGRVIGVDMTPEMLSKARANAEKHGFTNVEFRLGEIENLPVANESIDLVISNCVVNLSPDKPRVFREALRVLRPGGRMVVSDIVLTAELPESVRTSVEAYVGCVAGAWMKNDYVRAIGEAGFENVEVVEERGYGTAADVGDDVAVRTAEAVRSVKVRAFKPTSRH